MEGLKKIRLLALAVLVSATLAASPAAAGMKDGMKDGMDNRYYHMSGVMEMLKETMTILRDLNHRPTDAEKQKLTEMINQIDEMMMKKKEMMKDKDKGMMKKKGM